MDELGIVYLALCMIIVFLALVALPDFGPGLYTYIAIALILITVAFLVIMNWADFLLFPVITSLLNITFMPAKDYKIIKTQDAIIKNVGGLYYATGYLTGNLFSYEFKSENPDQDMEEKIAGASDKWERAVMSIDFPFKFHVLSCGRDIQQARDELEGRRSYVEFQMSRAIQGGKTSDVEIGELQRKLDVYQAQINRISQGEKPISTLMYVETIAVGVTEKAAVDTLASQVKRLQVSLGSLDIDLLRVVGRELYTLFTFNFTLPINYDGIRSNFDLQG